MNHEPDYIQKIFGSNRKSDSPELYLLLLQVFQYNAIENKPRKIHRIMSETHNEKYLSIPFIHLKLRPLVT
jgi:hypothetical protein